MALVGYRDLAWLKARVLPGDMSDETAHDADLSEIGRGVAAHFDRFTGRVLRRTAGVVFETMADQEAVVVSCYPIEEVTAAELVIDGTASDISDAIANIQKAAGIVWFYGAPSVGNDLLRLTIRGGYWCQDGDSDTLPSGATALPDDLLDAWVRQVRAVCEAENIFRAKGAEKPDKKTGGGVTLESLTLLPSVRAVLQLHLKQG